MTTWFSSPELYADAIDRLTCRARRDLQNSVLGHPECLEELWQVWKDCRESNWDGFGALPVDQDTYTTAYRLIESLPLKFPRPSVGAEPDGQLTLEWHKTESRTLSVSVDPLGYLHYAGLYGSDRRFGTLALFSDTPDQLIQLVSDL